MEKSWKKIILITVFIFLSLWGCEELFRRKIGGLAGSYPYVSTWEINANEEVVIEKIKEIKISNPKLQPPNDTNLISGRSSYWNYITFYYSDTEELVHTWTRPSEDSNKTTIALVSFSPINNSTNHKLINKDFWFIPNLNRKIKFERVVINHIKERIDNSN